MKLSLTVIALLASACAGESLRGHSRRLNNAFNTVYTQLTASSPPGSCTKEKKDGSTIVTCERPDMNARLVAEGDHTKPVSLRVCDIGSVKMTCKSWLFSDDSMRTQDVVEEALPRKQRSPGSSYVVVMSALKKRYYRPGECVVAMGDGKTTVKCANRGTSATLTADGHRNPAPETLTVCQYSQATDQCKTYSFKGSSAASVLSRAGFK